MRCCIPCICNAVISCWNPGYTTSSMSRWDRYVLRPRLRAETSGSETVPHIGPYNSPHVIKCQAPCIFAFLWWTCILSWWVVCGIHVVNLFCLGSGAHVLGEQDFPMWCFGDVGGFVLVSCHLFLTPSLNHPLPLLCQDFSNAQINFVITKNSGLSSKCFWILKGLTFLLWQKLVKPLLKNPEKCHGQDSWSHGIFLLVVSSQKLF